MATKSKKPVKTPAKKSGTPTKSTPSAVGSRSSRRKLTRKQKKHEARKEQNYKKLPAAWMILADSLKQLYRNKKLFVGILLVYAGLNTLFVTGISGNFPLRAIRSELAETTGNSGGFNGGIELFGQLIGTGRQASSEAGGVYQTVFIIIGSLALIWALRQTFAKTAKLRIRDSFYEGMGQLIPFTIILLIILLQMVPLMIGGSIFSIVQANGIANTGIAQFLWGLVFGLGLLTTLYLISSSVIALYIVTLPGTAPLNALRQAKKIVRYRRSVIIRKIAFLPLVLLAAAALLLIPSIIIFSPAAEALFLLFNIVLLGVVHSYMYRLYRSLL